MILVLDAQLWLFELKKFFEKNIKRKVRVFWMCIRMKKKKKTTTSFQSDFVCFQIQFVRSIKDRPHQPRFVHRRFSIHFCHS